MKRAHASAFQLNQCKRLLRNDVACLRTLRPVFDVELDGLTLGQGSETGTLNRAEVNEHICTTIVLSDETEALGFVKPFNSTCSHEYLT